MEIVTFPILNLELRISQIAFSLFGINIHWYAIFIVLAILLALMIFKRRDNLYGIKFSVVLDLLVYLVPISIISARIYYILFNLNYYIDKPLQALNLRTGGLAIYGGIIGGLLTCIVYCKRKKINVLDLLDYIVPATALRTSDWKMGEFY